jgi:tetratricopeptide (TPR) repeat protein
MKKKLFALLFVSGIMGTIFGQTTSDGIKAFHYERLTSAEKILNQVVTQNPSEINAWFWLVRTCIVKGDFAKAETALSSIPNNLQGQPLYKVIQGAISLNKGDTLAAKTDFDMALGSSRKKDPAIQLAIAEINTDAAKGNIIYALELLDDAAKKDKRNAAIYAAKGDIYRKLYNGSEAYRNFQQAVDLDPTSPVNYYKIGKIYQTQNNDAVFTGYYTDAIKADPDFGPVYFQLYYYYYFKDVSKALDYFQKYIAHSDPDRKNDYLLTDLYFISKKYTEAINEAKATIAAEKGHPKPRIYKLLAYSYDAINDNKNAEESLKTYFSNENDSNYIAKDFELMAKIADQNKQPSEAATWYEKAYTLEKDNAEKIGLVRKLAQFYKMHKQYDKQAYWFEQLYTLKAEMTNVDIFNWGVANYNAHNYAMADSVFGIYETKYPDQSFGYYWRAKSNAAMDTALETGIAVPHYENLIKVGLKDSANPNTRKWLIQAYGYIAAYKVNKEKMYTDALSCYDRILSLDPGNNDAEKYKSILEKMIESSPGKPANNK